MRPVRLLDEDPDLFEAVPAGHRARAADTCLAPVVVVDGGTWNPGRADAGRGAIGLLILNGLVLRRLGVGGRFGAELLGAGDLLRPADSTDSSFSTTTAWRVIDQIQMAVLTAGVAERVARFPSLTGTLVAKALSRSRRLVVMMAIVHQPRVEVRVHMLLWHLADRWGRVRGEGVLVPLRLSHSVLADLTAAQRPSVTGALQRLYEKGVVRQLEEGWLLCGDPPGEVLEVLAAAEQPLAGPAGERLA
ncbi:MAG TPA: helix-turn-helix domain-containing protein [Solirubrobacteraceae bacterium]|nr:helix-turn-helix domain-containing protein [Solirubrobacteraceae bacterium]